jgi:N-acetylmuramoyl-L-alanine amidase
MLVKTGYGNPPMSLPMEQAPSPNFGPRVNGQSVDVLLLHYTGMAGADRALKWLRDPESGVSAHYFVFEDGRLVQLVDERDRAWHAGKSSWAGEADINSRSIGIEIANPGHEFGYVPFPDRQIRSVISLCRDILSRHAIPARRVLAHSDVAPDRKSDPGELFPWQTLHEAGVGLWVAPAPIEPGDRLAPGDGGKRVERLQRLLMRFGYDIVINGRFGLETAAVVRAFQRHFRPERVDGIADQSTLRTLDKLLAAAL